MEETEIDNKQVTEIVLHLIKQRGVKKKWFYEKLDLTQPTFANRLEQHNWKKSEILALQQLNIIK